MNPLQQTIVPAVETTQFLLLLALICFVTGMHMLTRMSTRDWGSNRLLYLLSAGNRSVGEVLALIIPATLIGVAAWAIGRVFGYV